MIRFGRTERRVVLAILVAAVVPLLTAMWLADLYITRISRTAFQLEFSNHLEQALGVYADLAQSMKRGLRAEAEAIAAQQPLRDAASAGDDHRLSLLLERELARRPDLFRIAVETADGEVVAERRRKVQVNRAKQRPFTVQRSLGASEQARTLTVVFLADQTRFSEMAGAHEFAQAYRQLADVHRREWVDQTYVRAFVVLFGLTVLLAIITGVLVVRPVIRRINRLAAATKPVAQGDLSIRVDAGGRDEIADLARAFNHMLQALGESRARVEFLKRIGEWQHMARRLAHEIKNPLTPIQLAVEECHRRYRGDDENYRHVLQSTLDMVEEEVAGLRRLVGEFAQFARLPRAELEPGELGDFIREQRARLVRTKLSTAEQPPAPGLEIRFDISDEAMPVALDRELLYHVLANLIANAVQAIDGEERPPPDGEGQVLVTAKRDGTSCLIAVEDSGPGIPPSHRADVFGPYWTSKREGTGLGLTIVKKIVIDHGGFIDVDESPLGGARFRIRLPCCGTSDSAAAVAQSQALPQSA